MAVGSWLALPETPANKREYVTIHFKLNSSAYAWGTLVLLSISLQLGDLPFFNGPLEDKGTYIFIGLYILLSMVYFGSSGKIRVHRDIMIVLFLFLLVDFLGIIRFLFHPYCIKAGYETRYLSNVFLFLVTKGYFLLTVNTFVRKLDGQLIERALKFYLYVFVISNVTAFVMLKAGLLVLEDVNQDRFAAFHDELVYYNFSALLALILLHRGKLSDWIMFVGGVCFLYRSTKSNVLPIFVLVLLGSWLILRLRWFKRRMYIFIPLIVLFIIVAIYNFQEWVVMVVELPWMRFVGDLFPRATFSAQTMGLRYLSRSGGDPVLVRIVLYQGGLRYFFTNLFGIPAGFGGAIFDVSYIDPRLWKELPTASGFTTFMADGLLFVFPILVILLRYLRNISRKPVVSIWQKRCFYILGLSITSLAVHGGYFNLPIWTIIMLCYRYLTLTSAESIEVHK